MQEKLYFPSFCYVIVNFQNKALSIIHWQKFNSRPFKTLHSSKTLSIITLSIITLSIITLSIITLRIITLSIIALGITALSITALSITTLSIK